MRLVMVFVLAACRFRTGNLGNADAGDAALDNAIDAPTSFVVEAESFTTITATTGYAWMMMSDVAGYSGTSFMQCVPNSGGFCDVTAGATCAHLGYAIVLGATGTYYVHVRMYATSTSDDSAWSGLDGVPGTAALQPAHDAAWHWVTGAATSISAGPHTIDLWQRECGARADVVALTPSATPPP